MRRDGQHVDINDSTRHANVLSVSAVIEQQVFAEVFLMARTVETGLTWRGIQGYDACPFFEAANPGANFFDHSR